MHLAPADARRLRSEGFISFMSQPIRGPRTAGVTNVALYETAEGAKHSLAHELRPDVIRALGPVENLRYFAVPGVPGARGWTASEPHVGNVQWVQGRCMLVLGNQGPGPVRGPIVERRAGDLRAHQRAVPVASQATWSRRTGPSPVPPSSSLPLYAVPDRDPVCARDAQEDRAGSMLRPGFRAARRGGGHDRLVIASGTAGGALTRSQESA